jgi:hypothetical protein
VGGTRTSRRQFRGDEIADGCLFFAQICHTCSCEQYGSPFVKAHPLRQLQIETSTAAMGTTFCSISKATKYLLNRSGGVAIAWE